MTKDEAYATPQARTIGIAAKMTYYAVLTPMITLQAYKPNGALHQTWQGELIIQSSDWCVVHTPIDASVRHHTKDLTYTMPHSNLGIFSSHEYYNVFIDFHRDKSFKRLYINIATPARWNVSTVAWSDLELDIIRYPNQAPELLDEDEFEAAQTSGLLPQTLADRAQKTAAILMKQVGDGAFPFLTVGYEVVLKQLQRDIK